jgi:hypothetical protein
MEGRRGQLGGLSFGEAGGTVSASDLGMVGRRSARGPLYFKGFSERREEAKLANRHDARMPHNDGGGLR